MENLVDESTSTEPWRNPEQGSQDTSKSSHELPMEPRAKVVSTTPQMTCFRGAKVRRKWPQGKVTINSYSLTTSWNWDQVEIGTKMWKSQHWTWLRGNTARCVHQWRHDHYHWQHEHLSVNAHCPVSSRLSAQCHISRTHTVAQLMSLVFVIHVINMCSWSERLSSTLLSPFYHSFHFFPHLKLVDNLLRTSHKESMDLSDEFYLSTGYEPNANDFKETSVEPYTELLDSPPFFSDKGFPADSDYDDAATCLSVCRRRQCPTERGDLLGQSGPAEQSSQEAQKQKEQILAECQVRINRHEFQAAYDRWSLVKLGEIFESQQEKHHYARAEEVQQRDQQLHQGQLLLQNFELREAHQKSLTEMEELKKFQSSTFDTIARRRLIEDQDTILELSGIAKWKKLYERFKGVSGCWINSQWKFPRYQSTSVFPTSSNSWRNAKPFYRNAEPQRRAAKHLGHTWYIGKRFCKSRCVIISTLSSSIESMEFIDRGAASFIHSGKEWKAKTRPRSENFEILDARIASALNRIIHNSHFKRRISLGNKRPRSRTVSFAEGRLLTWSTLTSGSLEPTTLSRTTPT